MIRRTPFLAACAIAGALASGCASKPTMHLNHAEVQGVQLGFPPSLSVLMTVVVDVYNPNGYDVAIRAMRGQVILANRYPLPVDFQAPGDGVWLASNAVTSVRVPTAIPVDLAVTLLREAYTSPVVPYHLIGKADVTASRTFHVEADDYSVDETGLITRDQFERAIRGY